MLSQSVSQSVHGQFESNSKLAKNKFFFSLFKNIFLVFFQALLARNFNLGIELRTVKSMWDMRRVPQSCFKMVSFVDHWDAFGCNYF